MRTAMRMTKPGAVSVSVAFLALVLMSGPLHSAPQKGPKPDVGTGRVAWFDITTTNMTQSKEFYGRLFDWQFESLPGPYADLAAEIVSRGTSIGTLRKAEGAISAYDGVARWAAANGVEITGAPREVYFVDFRSAAPGDEVCDVAFPVR